MTIRLHLRAMRVLEVVEDLPERLVVAVVAISSVIRCGDCGFKTKRVHATRKVKVADLPVSGRPVTLVWHRRRFRCGNCGTTTTESHPFIGHRMTQRLARAVVRNLRDMTVLAVARRYGLSWHRVMGLVAAEGRLLARHRRRRPCRVLLVDEKSMRKGQGQYSTILVDGDRGRVVAVLEGRSADVLGGFLARQSPAWRKGVSMVVGPPSRSTSTPAATPPTPPPRASTARSRCSSAWPTGSGREPTTSHASCSSAPGTRRRCRLHDRLA
jgi:transposase